MLLRWSAAAMLALGMILGVSRSDNRANDIELLKSRVNAWAEALKEGRYEVLLGMRASSIRRDDEEREKVKRFVEESSRGIKIESWSIEGIERRGRIAKVQIMTKALVKENDTSWVEANEESVTYWVYEKKNWFSLGKKPDDWGDGAQK